jgi:hypothetical protein
MQMNCVTSQKGGHLMSGVGLGPAEVAIVCLIGLIQLAIPIAVLVVLVFLYQRVRRIEEKLDQRG